MFKKKNAPVNGEAAVDAAPRKGKKPVYRKWWFWFILLFVIAGIGSSGGKSASKETRTPKVSAAPTSASAPTAAPAPTPNIPLDNDFEIAVWQCVDAYKGELISIDTIQQEQEGGETIINTAVKLPNSEETVLAVLTEIGEKFKATPENESAILSIADIDAKDDIVIAIASVSPDGTTSVSSMSLDYNSARNQWIKSQFSVWDGAHTGLEKLVIKQLNDEKSYKHIETTYRDIDDEAARDEINDVLAKSGYEQRVEVGDLFIQMQFSAKNAFGGTIKNTAFGIASYSSDTITLIDIG